MSGILASKNWVWSHAWLIEQYFMSHVHQTASIYIGIHIYAHIRVHRKYDRRSGKRPHRLLVDVCAYMRDNSANIWASAYLYRMKAANISQTYIYIHIIRQLSARHKHRRTPKLPPERDAWRTTFSRVNG